MKKITSDILVHNKKYPYNITDKGSGVVFFECKAGHIAQDFLAEDLGKLILDLPNLIIAEKEYGSTQSEVIRFRVGVADKKRIEQNASKKGYASVSGYVRDMVLC